MNNISYNIWGIRNNGYSNSHVTNMDSKSLSLCKNSFTDNHRTICNDFSTNNPNDKYLYSIERINQYVLYTIYRTNWYKDARLSYDAISILISEEYTIPNTIDTLNSLMSLYESQQNEININKDIIESKLLKISLSRNSQIRRPSNNETGFLKYSDTNTLKNNFNHINGIRNLSKVYFFSKLPFIENNGINVQMINESLVTILNYNEQKHDIAVNNIKESNLHTAGTQVISCYNGDKITGTKNGRLIKEMTVDSQKNNEIKFPKSKKRGNNSNNFYNPKNFLLITGILLLISVVLFIIKPWEDKGTPVDQPMKVSKIIFENDTFRIIDNDTTINVSNSKKIINQLKNDNGIKFTYLKDKEDKESIEVRYYKLISSDDLITVSLQNKTSDVLQYAMDKNPKEWKQTSFDEKDKDKARHINYLYEHILKDLKGDTTIDSVIKEIKSYTDKIIFTYDLTKAKGEKLGNNFWKLEKNQKKHQLRYSNDGKEWNKLDTPIEDRDGLVNLLKPKIPLSIFNKIQRYHNDTYPSKTIEKELEKKKKDIPCNCYNNFKEEVEKVRKEIKEIMSEEDIKPNHFEEFLNEQYEEYTQSYNCKSSEGRTKIREILNEIIDFNLR